GSSDLCPADLRPVFSPSRIISHQYAQGADYRNSALPEVYFIGILDFRMDPEEQQRYIRRVELTDRDTGKVFYSKLKYIFLELAKFRLYGLFYKAGESSQKLAC